MVDVSNKQNNAVIKVTVSNGNTNITATADTAQYWSKQSRLSAENSKESAQEAKNYAELANSYIEGFEDVVSNNTNNIIVTSNDYINQITGTANTALTNIEDARVDAVNNITTVKSESIASVEAKGNEVVSTVNEGIANINTAKTEAVNAVTTTKNNAVTEINKEVTDGKKELNDIIEAGGLNINDKLTNCLLEVPQNIKLELKDGTLTLKAGSKVIVPNGVGVFEEVVIDTDKTLTNAFGGTYNNIAIALRPDINSLVGDVMSTRWCSGATDTLADLSGGHFWYDTTENIVKWINNGKYVASTSLPICLMTNKGGEGFKSITTVFNGFGDIGSHIFADKGIKYLVANGRNKDGTLKNIERTTKSVIIAEALTVDRTWILNESSLVRRVPENVYEQDTAPTLPQTAHSVWFNPKENYYYEAGANTTTWKRINTYIVIGNARQGYLDFKLPFRAVDYNDIKDLLNADHSNDTKPYITETYVSGTSGYRVWSDGFKQQWGSYNNGSAVRDKYDIKATFLKPFNNANYNMVLTAYNNNNDPRYRSAVGTVYNKTSTSVTMGWFGIDSNQAVQYLDWYACGY